MQRLEPTKTTTLLQKWPPIATTRTLIVGAALRSVNLLKKLTGRGFDVELVEMGPNVEGLW